MVRDFDDNEFPLAYFISFRTYGTWLHGDDRTSTTRKQNKYDTSHVAPNQHLQRAEIKQLKRRPLKLNAPQRPVVEEAIREVCTHRGYLLRAINVRTNHVHTVVSAATKPEPILQAFQAYATRKLRGESLLPADVKAWARHAALLTSGTNDTWSEQLVTSSTVKAMNCLRLMIERCRRQGASPL